jgi:hypothetical protein
MANYGSSHPDEVDRQTDDNAQRLRATGLPHPNRQLTPLPNHNTPPGRNIRAQPCRALKGRQFASGIRICCTGMASRPSTFRPAHSRE